MGARVIEWSKGRITSIKAFETVEEAIAYEESLNHTPTDDKEYQVVMGGVESDYIVGQSDAPLGDIFDE